MMAARGAVLISLALCACASTVEEPLDAQPERISRARWVRQEIDRWNAHLDAAGRAEKYAKLRESAPTFFRGTSHLFWSDHAPRGDLRRYGNPHTVTWIQGDCHVENFGSFDDAGGRVVYGLDDFDDAWIADYQLDVWRLATSIVLFATENGIPEATSRAAVDALAAAYLRGMRDFSRDDSELSVENDEAHTQKPISDLLAEVAAEESPGKLVDKWTDGERFDLAIADLAAVSEAERAAVTAALAPRHAVRDVARRLHAGTSSLGATRYYVLTGEMLILDVKAAARPVPGREWAAPVDGDAATVAARGQRALTRDVDPQLTAVKIDGAPYLVRALSPYKDDLSKKQLKAGLVDAAAQWGRILAAAHARGDRDSDAALVPVSVDEEIVAAVGADEDGFRALVWQRASAYAVQAARDFAAFRQN